MGDAWQSFLSIVSIVQSHITTIIIIPISHKLSRPQPPAQADSRRAPGALPRAPQDFESLEIFKIVIVSDMDC